MAKKNLLYRTKGKVAIQRTIVATKPKVQDVNRKDTSVATNTRISDYV